MKRGFTLIELLLVIAIMGVLASILVSSLQSARAGSRDTIRKRNLKELQTALELYYYDHGNYPITTNKSNPARFIDGADWRGESNNGGAYPLSGVGGYIPGLAPQYIKTLPSDSFLNQEINTCSAGDAGYWYVSNGKNYKIKAKCLAEKYPVPNNDFFYDPGGRISTYVVYTSGARMW
jgi:prepilin-type N-terminal cleavage/methylation domain-containing protein